MEFSLAKSTVNNPATYSLLSSRVSYFFMPAEVRQLVSDPMNIMIKKGLKGGDIIDYYYCTIPNSRFYNKCIVHQKLYGNTQVIDSPNDPVTPKWLNVAFSWIKTAHDEIGIKELKAKGEHTARIIEYHNTTTLHAKDDETPWCSSFVNWCMKQAGFEGTHSALALSWKNWGKKLDEPVYGSIAVIKHSNGTGHVGFVVGKSGTRIVLLGGNQSDQVKLSSFNTANVIAYVVPINWIVRLEDYQLQEINVNTKHESTR